MNCVETKKSIEALLDGELGNGQRDAVERHLITCVGCCEWKERMLSLSSLLQVNRVDAPSAELDMRMIKSFRNYHSVKQSTWQRVVFGAFVIPKPTFAIGLILATAGFWLAFQIGKINSTTLSMTSPVVISNEIPLQTQAKPETLTVFVEVPVIKEKIVTRTVFIREQKGKIEKRSNISRANILASSSSVAENGYFTDLNLKGFQPPADIGMRIIKEEKKDEK